MDEGMLARGLAAEGAVRWVAVSASGAADEARVAHGLIGDAARVIGECVAATAALSAYIKGEESVALQIQSESPRFAYYGDIDAEGHIRARLTPSSLEGADGTRCRGLLFVIKSDAEREIYRGVTSLADQSLTEALSAHLAESSQSDCAIRISAHLDDAGRVHASAILVERLPAGADLPTLDAATFASTFDLSALDAHTLVEEVARGTLVGSPVVRMDERPIVWRCRCALERVEGVLVALGSTELADLLRTQGSAHVTCHFCNRRWAVDRVGLEALIVKAREAEG